MADNITKEALQAVQAETDSVGNILTAMYGDIATRSGIKYKDNLIKYFKELADWQTNSNRTAKQKLLASNQELLDISKRYEDSMFSSLNTAKEQKIKTRREAENEERRILIA